jgi:uncharacterized Zn-finger protein
MSIAKAAVTSGTATPNDNNKYEVVSADLPLHCPMPEMSLWNSHPRVYLSMDKGHAICPYCSAEFSLKKG